jgi:hypothetical protein
MMDRDPKKRIGVIDTLRAPVLAEFYHAHPQLSAVNALNVQRIECAFNCCLLGDELAEVSQLRLILDDPCVPVEAKALVSETYKVVVLGRQKPANQWLAEALRCMQQSVPPS